MELYFQPHLLVVKQPTKPFAPIAATIARPNRRDGFGGPFRRTAALMVDYLAAEGRQLTARFGEQQNRADFVRKFTAILLDPCVAIT